MNPAPPTPSHGQQQYPPHLQQQAQQHQSPYHGLPSDYAQNTAAAALSSASSPQNHPPAQQNGAPPQQNARKRKAGQPGSRGVANLTPEQLAKKRANDREAQRAIRERTKNTIESLENRIRELESQQPYQELQRALQDRDRALAECETLRQRLTAVAGIVGSRDLGQTGLNELAALTAQQSPLPPVATAHLDPDLRGTAASNAASPYGSGSHHSYEQNGTPAAMQQQQPHYQADQGAANSPAPPAPMYSAPPDRKWSPRPDYPPPRQAEPQMTTQDLQIRDLAYRLTSLQVTTCPLDHLMSDFVRQQRARISNGHPIAHCIGPDQPTIASLISPSHPKLNQPDPITDVLCDILSKFPDLAILPERLATLYGMYHIARFLIHPCVDTYERMAEFDRPVPESLEHEHASYHDYCPWPFIRKQLALDPTIAKFDDFFVPFTKEISVNWPYSHNECVEYYQSAEGGGEQVRLTRQFETHIRRLENWSVGPAFAKEFPRLIDGSVRIEG